MKLLLLLSIFLPPWWPWCPGPFCPWQPAPDVCPLCEPDPVCCQPGPTDGDG